MKQNKSKGSVILDSILIVSMLLASGVVILLVYKVMSAASVSTNSTLNQTYFNQGLAALRVFNEGFVVVVFFSFLVQIMLAYYVRSHPMFLAIVIFTIPITILVCTILANFYLEFAGHSDFAEVTVQYPAVTLFFQNLPKIVLVISFIIAIILYSNIKGGQIAP